MPFDKPGMESVWKAYRKWPYEFRVREGQGWIGSPSICLACNRDD